MADASPLPPDEVSPDQLCPALLCGASHDVVSGGGDGDLPEGVGVLLQDLMVMVSRSGHQSCYDYLQQVQAELNYSRRYIVDSMEKAGVSLEDDPEGPGTCRKGQEDEEEEEEEECSPDMPATSRVSHSIGRRRRRGSVSAAGIATKKRRSTRRSRKLSAEDLGQVSGTVRQPKRSSRKEEPSLLVADELEHARRPRRKSHE